MEATTADLDFNADEDIGSVLSWDFDEMIEVLGVTYQMDSEISKVCNEVGLLNFSVWFLSVGTGYQICIFESV